MDATLKFKLVDNTTHDSAINIMAEAFHDDPVVRHISEDRRLPKYLYSVSVPFYRKHGEVWINESHTAVLMCLPPPKCHKKCKPSIFQLAVFVYLFGFSALRRGASASGKAYALRKNSKHYYICAVGTTLEGRGKGHAGEILRYFKERVVEEGSCLYKENTNPELNTGLYSFMGMSAGPPVSLGTNAPAFIPTYYRG